MIWIVAGTWDGRQIALRLEEEGWPVLASSVTDYGQLLLQESLRGETLSGPLDAESMSRVIQQRSIRLVIDATHPYAIQATRNIQQACGQEGIPWVRFERESLYGEQGSDAFDRVTWAEDVLAAAQQARAYPGGIFLATGSRSLQTFARELGPEKLIARVLPTLESIQACQAAGINPGCIVALQGPFSVELNRELLRHYGARLLITKESGKAGGFLEKVEAAGQLQLPVIAIRRPGCDAQMTFSRVEELLSHVADLFL